MQLKLPVTILLSIICCNMNAQNSLHFSLDIGDSAPPLRTSAWIKGERVDKFEKQRVYVLEYWATWCKPCKAEMPHLSALAIQYRDEVTFIGINAFEMKGTSPESVYRFVDSMGKRMDYHVAMQDSAMWSSWINASGEETSGIPRTFVVDDETRLAWIGHPKDLDKVLEKIVNRTWDVRKAQAKRKSDKYLASMDDSLNYELMQYQSDFAKLDYRGKPDSGLSAISEMIEKEPGLKYAPLMAFNTFTFLLKTDMKKALEYGNAVITTPSYDEPACDAIIAAIDMYSEKLTLPAYIYQLGAQAYQIEINRIPYPELFSIHDYFDKMAAWYWRAKDTSNAIKAQQQAIEVLRNKGNYSTIKMNAFASRLAQYRGTL